MVDIEEIDRFVSDGIVLWGIGRKWDGMRAEADELHTLVWVLSRAVVVPPHCMIFGGDCC